MGFIILEKNRTLRHPTLKDVKPKDIYGIIACVDTYEAYGECSHLINEDCEIAKHLSLHKAWISICRIVNNVNESKASKVENSDAPKLSRDHVLKLVNNIKTDNDHEHIMHTRFAKYINSIYDEIAEELIDELCQK
jgi:hypothetical protein